MAEHSVFIRNNPLRGLDETIVAGESVLDSYARVAARLVAIAGDDVAALFARPAVTRGNGETESVVAWYIAKPGAMRNWGSLARDEQIRMASEIGQLLDRFRMQIGDPEIGAILGGWLSIPALDNDIMIVGDRPYLLNWGTLPSALAHDPGAITAHQRATLDLFGNRALADGARQAAASAAASVTAGSAAKQGRGFGWGRKPAAENAAVAVAAETASVAAPAAPSPRRRDWLPVTIAAAIAGLALLISFIPGVLVRDPWQPPAPPAPAISDAERAQAMESAQRRIQQLRQELDGQVCRPIPPAPGAPGVPGAPGNPGTPAAPGAPGRSGALPSIQPSPASLPGPITGSLTRAPESLKDYLIQATALVIAEGEDRRGSGTAFFINDRQLVTNRHVVESAINGNVKIATSLLGGSVAARIVAITPPGDVNDFAVLEIQTAGQHPIIPLQMGAEQLQPVVAAGYPDVAASGDDAYKRALGGDPRAAPTPVLSQGQVMAKQTREDVPVLLHSAAIYPGNSGGPLVDPCGRLLGVNTFVRRNQEQIVSLNYALGTEPLSEFLRSKQISFTADAACPAPAPAALGAQPPAAAPAPTAKP